uniref:RNA-binding protein RO60 vWA domain-containing protein n=1 Tax=Cacopsylla melanoneura TaxID=428564 RepID=A0A8D8QUQ3_9HEMI
MVCLDLQSCMSSRWVHNYPALTGSHVAMHLMEVLYRMVGEKSDQLRVVGFKDVKVKPIKRLKLHVKEGTTASATESESNLEKLDDLVDELAEKCNVKSKTEDETKVKQEEEEEEDKSTGTDNIIAGYEKLWKHYKSQVPEARGVTFHKLLSWANKQLWDPDVFVVICSQDNVSLYKNNIVFGEYVQKPNRSKTKLITISPCSHLKSCRLIHAKNMLHIVGFDEKVTHLIDDFLSDKIQPLKVESEAVAASTCNHVIICPF